MRLPLAASLVAVLSSPSLAGPLAETARGVDNKVDTHTSHDSAPPPPSNPDPTPSPHYDDDCTSCGTAVVVGASAASYSTVEESDPPGGSSTPLLTGPGRLDLYLGAHSVIDSDGAVIGELRASKDWIGLGVSGIRYVEHIEGKPGEDDITLDLMAFTISGRLLAWSGTELWLDGGMAASGSSEYDTILGTAWSARVEHALNPDLALRSQVRFYALEHDVFAVEAWGGVRAWFLQAGYRTLKFNVGPALHGPEAGLALRF